VRLPSWKVLAIIVSIRAVHSGRGTVGIGISPVDCLRALQVFLGSLSGIASHNSEKENQSKSLESKTQVSNVSVMR
jgi:hypothetical protein